MELKPSRQQHDLDRHHRYRSPGQHAKEREQKPREDITFSSTAAGADRFASPPHVVRLRRVADNIERKIGSDACAHVKFAVVKQRPPTMRFLNATEVNGNF